MIGSPGYLTTQPPALSEIRAIFDEACERRQIQQPSAAATELARLMLSSYADGLRDRQSFYELADIYP